MRQRKSWSVNGVFPDFYAVTLVFTHLVTVGL